MVRFPRIWGVIWEMSVNCVVMMMAEKLSDAILGRPPLEPIDADFVIRASAPGGAHGADR